MQSSKKISASLFALILVCFFLPFVTVSCENRPVLQLSGIELTTGKTIANPTFTGRTQKQDIPPNVGAVLAFTAAGIGLGISFTKVQKASMISTVSGAAGALLLLLMKSGIDGELAKQGAGIAGFKTNYEVGFWGAFLLFISSAILNSWLLFRRGIGRSQDF
jgi:hypothetical protein